MCFIFSNTIQNIFPIYTSENIHTRFQAVSFCDYHTNCSVSLVLLQFLATNLFSHQLKSASICPQRCRPRTITDMAPLTSLFAGAFRELQSRHSTSETSLKAHQTHLNCWKNLHYKNIHFRVRIRVCFAFSLQVRRNHLPSGHTQTDPAHVQYVLIISKSLDCKLFSR